MVMKVSLRADLRLGRILVDFSQSRARDLGVLSSKNHINDVDFNDRMRLSCKVYLG